ncbi:MAG TPA: hypothetical protein VK563_15900 [Puia sp.]|nr:hypothetical protein [Puia sp.]
MLFFYSTVIAIELICLIFSLFLLSGKRTGWYRQLIWLLVLVVGVESSGFYIYFIRHFRSNYLLFNIFLPVYVFYTGWIMYQMYRPLSNSRILITGMLAVFSAIYLLESIPTHFIVFSANANTSFSICMVIICLVYYYFLIKTEDFIDVYRYADFWLVTGLFFFHFVSTASNFFFKYMTIINKDSIVPIRYSIEILINFILYSCWVYAFICRYRKTISS